MELTSTTLSFGYAYCVSCLKGGCQRRLGHKIRTVPIYSNGQPRSTIFTFVFTFVFTCLFSLDLTVAPPAVKSHTTPVVKPYERTSGQGMALRYPQRQPFFTAESPVFDGPIFSPRQPHGNDSNPEKTSCMICLIYPIYNKIILKKKISKIKRIYLTIFDNQ